MDPDKSLIPRPATGLATKPTTSNPVIRRMTEDLLAQARQSQVQQARFRIGGYELREPDYQQICLWAEALAMAPEELLGVLASSSVETTFDGGPEPIHFTLDDGAIDSLVWDFDRLPEFPDRWVQGLRLHTIFFIDHIRDGGISISLAPQVASLRRLGYFRLTTIRRLREQPALLLDISRVPQLSALICLYSNLTELDLSPVSGLTELDCSWSQLTELDLSPVNRPGFRGGHLV